MKSVAKGSVNQGQKNETGSANITENYKNNEIERYAELKGESEAFIVTIHQYHN